MTTSRSSSGTHPALAGDPAANAVFEGLGRSGRYVLFLPLLKASTPEARARALVKAVARLTAQG